MIRFFAKLLLLAGVLIGLKAALWWGIHTFRAKWSFLYEANYKRYSLLWPIRHRVNTMFIGSSRTAFSFVPAQFDSLTYHRTCSFNHGLSGLLVPDTFDECEQIIQMDGLKLQTVFFELSFPAEATQFDPFDKEHPFAELGFKIDYLINHPLKPGLLKEMTTLLDSFVGQFLLLKGPISIALHSVNKTSDENIVMTPKGYRYFRNVSRLKQAKAPTPVSGHLEEVTSVAKADTEPSAYRRRIQQLISLCEQKGIALYFIIPNHLIAQESRVLPGIYATIPVRHRFDIPVEHNSVGGMGVKYSDDGVHLNRRGAVLFTARFAARYNQYTQATAPK